MNSPLAHRALTALSFAAVLAASTASFAGPIDTDQVVITEAETREGRASSIPWSGIWWAFSDLEIATGWNGTGADFEHIDGQGWQRKNPSKDINDVSPLLKYDAFVERRTGSNPGAALKECEGDEAHDFAHSIYGEKKAEYDREGISYSWWGHCNGWCAASLLEKEPIAPVVAEGIRFDVADLKGLLSETFWGVESDFTGRRYNRPRRLYSDNRQAGKDLLAALEDGNPNPVADYIEWYEKVYERTMSESAKANATPEDFRDELEGFEDWFVDRYDEAFSDLEPHVLHGLLETLIGRKKLAFVMDVTANEEVWNHPAFAYTSDITHKRDFTENGKSFKEWDVETKVWYATDGVSHSILGIKDFYKTYNYTMVTDENDKVIRSAWVGNSIDNHPDFAWLPTNNPAGADDGENPNVRYDEIKRILPKVHRASEDRALNISADGVTALSRRDEDKTTTWANPIPSSRNVTLTAAVASSENIRTVRYFEQKVDSYSVYSIVENEPLIALGESSTGPDFSVAANFSSNGRKMVVAFAYDGNNRLIAYDEITLQVSQSGSGNTNNNLDDSYEENDSQSAATLVRAGSYPNLRCNDDDWFKVTLPNSGDLKIDVDFQHSDGDLDITVHNGTDQLGKSDSTSNRETVELSNLAAGTYFVRVYGYNGAKNDYELTVTAATATPTQGDPFEPNDSRSAAAMLVPGDYPTLVCDDDDWFQVVLTERSKISAEIRFQHSEGDLDFVMTDSAGEKLHSSESTADQETVEKSGLAAGTYYLRVFGYNGAKAAYALTLSVERESTSGPAPSNDDAFEDNDTQTTAALISSGEHSNLICKDKDWYKVVVPANGQLTVKIRFQHSTGDLDMVMTSESGSVLARSESTSNEETVTKSNLAAGTYYIRVYGYDGAEAPYSMTVNP